MSEQGTASAHSSRVYWVRIVVVGLLLASAAINTGGYLLNGYDRLVWYDELCHLFTMFAVVAGAGCVALHRSPAVRSLGRTGFVAAATGAGLMIGIAWEAFEYAIGILGSPRDTAIDLALDTLGAVLAGAWLWHSGVGRAEGN